LSNRHFFFSFFAELPVTTYTEQLMLKRAFSSGARINLHTSPIIAIAQIDCSWAILAIIISGSQSHVASDWYRFSYWWCLLWSL